MAFPMEANATNVMYIQEILKGCIHLSRCTFMFLFVDCVILTIHTNGHPRAKHKQLCKLIAALYTDTYTVNHK